MAQFFKNYNIVSRIFLGKSEIYSCLNKNTQKPFVCKKVPKKYIKRELSVLNMDHPNINPIYESFDLDDASFLVMEKGDGDLVDLLTEKKLPAFTKMNIIYQMTLSLHYLQRNNVFHGDIKLENFIYKKVNDVYYHVKLIDFETSIDTTNRNIMYGLKGSPTYVSPEMVLSKRYTYKSDNWSLGICAYSILTEKYPFNFNLHELKTMNYKDYNLYYKICYDIPEWNNLEYIQKNFVLRLLRRNPQERMSIEDALNHDYLTAL